MSTDWRAPYYAAIRQHDPARLKDLCASARRAIFDRLLEIARAHAQLAAEKEELEEASRTLTLHEHRAR